MNIESGGLQFHTYQTGGRTDSVQTSGKADASAEADGKQGLSGNAVLSSAKQGQMFQGQIVDTDGSRVTIRMDAGNLVQARMEDSVRLNIGDTLSFLVKENDGGTVWIRPLAEDVQAMKDQTILNLLDMNGLSPSEKNYQIAETLLDAGMSADRTGMQKVMQQSYQFPDADIRSLVSMNRMGLPVNAQTIEGFTQYETNRHAMMQALSDFTGELTAYAAQTDPAQGTNPYQDMMQLLSDPADAPVLDTDGLLRNFQIPDSEQLPATENGQNPVLAGQTGVVMPQGASESATADHMAAAGTGQNAAGLSSETIAGYAQTFGITEADMQTLTDGLVYMGFDTQAVEELLQKSDSPMQLMNHLQELLPQAADRGLVSEAAIQDFFQSGSVEKLFFAAVRDKFSLDPSQMQDPQEVTELYRGIYEKMDHIMQQLGGQADASGEHLAQSAKGMQERIDFLQNLSNLYPYAQIPVRFEGQDANADLYVYMNKQRMQQKKEDVSALLHLDMDHLGPTDVHVSLRGTMVHTKFYVEDAESARIIDEHMSQLEQAVAENGYALTNEVIMRQPTLTEEPQKNEVIKEMFGDDKEPSVRRFSFDVRA